MEILNLIIEIINKAASFIRNLLSYKGVYTVTGAFFTRKFKKARHFHKYAVLVAARNEEAVIGNLIDSINKQDYPRELVTVFVVADNCTDATAAAARKNGAICYERLDTQHCTKGYALQFLVECIGRDYGIEAFEGYFLFDADNLLKQDYITRMNESFDEGLKIITSYRNAKHFGDNWISASYGLHWLRTIRKEHRARSLFILLRRTLVYLLKFAVILMGGHFVFRIFNINIFGLFRFEQPLECNVLSLTVATLYTTVVSCFNKVLNAAYVFIIEARRIEAIPLFKKIWFCITFPLFDIIGKYSLLVALFTKVE